MVRWQAVLGFLATLVVIVGGTHYYLWARLVRDPHLPPFWAHLGTGLFLALAVSIPSVMVATRALGLSVPRPIIWLVLCWFGVFFILFTLTLTSEVIRGGAWLAARWLPGMVPHDPGRRFALMRLLSGGVAAGATAATVAALQSASRGPYVAKVRVGLRRLSPSLDGFKVVQISDLHVAPLLRADYVTHMVEMANALEPDLIVLTGDLVDGTVDELRDDIAPLGRLHAPHGVYCVTGNHEYYSGAEAWLAHFATLGIKPLRNERVAIGTQTAGFDLAGVDDYASARFGGSPDLPRALSGRDAGREVVLLAHQPKAIFEAAQHGVGLMLSGHTHGGQIWPFGYLVRLAQPYLKGLHQHGATQIYVNPGSGYWGPPMRLGVPAEVTLLELRSSPA